jgi:hypothetical protein
MPPPVHLPSTMATAYCIAEVKTFGSDNVRFSGGGMHPGFKACSVPVSSLTYHPDHDLHSMMRVEEHCKTPLNEAKWIDDTPDCPVTFSRWLNDIK